MADVAFWTVVANQRSLNPALDNGPLWPAGGQPESATIPGDVYLLLPNAQQVPAAAHQHTLVGTLSAQSADSPDHYHFVPFVVGQPVDICVGTPPHVHPLSPDQAYFLVFVQATAAQFAAMTDPNLPPGLQVIPLAFALPDPDTGGWGALDATPWDPTTQAQIAGLARQLFGFDLPAEIDNGAALIALVLPALLARRVVDERAVRG